MTRNTRTNRRRIAVAAGVFGLTAGALTAGTVQSSAAVDDDTRPTLEQAIAGANGVVNDLGKEAAGVYVDGKQAVVNVTDRSAFDEVRASGAKPRFVKHSTAALERAEDRLQTRTDIAGTSWAIDPTSNRVEVRADESVDAQEMRRLRTVAAAMGDKVSVQRIPGRLSTRISGGDAIYGGGGRCSLGFHVTDGSSNYFLTAGHCTDIAGSWFEDQAESALVGDTVEGSFPGDDYGLATMEGDGGEGDVNNYDGSYTDITGAREATVGETVERSGSTTGLHDGSVLALDATVNYQEGTVEGLIETDVCAEPGDSGGALFSGGDALGLTSGGSGNCSSGGTTYFQPVTEPLDQYGMSVY